MEQPRILGSSAFGVASSGGDSSVDGAGSAVVLLRCARNESLLELSGLRVGSNEVIVCRLREKCELIGAASSEHSSAHSKGNTNGA